MTSSTTTIPIPSTSASTTPDAVLVLGDWGSGTLPQGAVAGGMAAYAERNPVQAILTTGDNFYQDDADFLMYPFDWAMESDIPFWISLGEEDVETAERVAAIDSTFDHPPPWATYIWGEVSIVVLDSNRVSDLDQVRFLEDELARIDGPTVVVFHHSAFACSAEGGTAQVREVWLPRLDADVFLVLSGHEHNFQRFVEQGRDYVVTGGGGAGLQRIGQCPAGAPELLEGAELHHFLAIRQTSEEVTVDVIDTTGSSISTFVIEPD